MRRALGVVGYLWTLPNTIFGVVLGLLCFQRPRLVGPLLVFDRGARGYSWLVPVFGFAAQTFGFVVISVRRLDGRLLEHEREHARQYCVWGPMYLPLYGLLFLRYGYRRHPFEVAAADAAGHAAGHTESRSGRPPS